MIKRIFFLAVLLLSLCLGTKVQARENVSSWYVKDLQSEIIINTDSSIDVTENIIADCGIAQKHGIYRTLPTFQQITPSEKIDSSVTLTSITDFNNNPIKYSENKNRSDKTIIWKIGDANVFVTGINNYRIKYHVKNAVRHNSADFDEFYWNLLGNFWDMEIDNFFATVTFPDSITTDNSKTNFYSGAYGDKNSLNISSNWISGNKLKVAYGKTLYPGDGITASVTFPKNIIAEYKPTFWEKYGQFFFLLIPVIIFILCFWLWKKFGDDPNINPTIAPEFEIPEKLAPIEMGLAYTDGILKNNFISASIINLAVNGLLKIEKVDSDFELEKLSGKYLPSDAEEKLIAGLFSTKDKVKISDLKNVFYTHLPIIGKAGNDFLINNRWLVKNSRLWQYLMIFLAVIVFFFSFGSFVISAVLGLAIIGSAIIVFIFSIIMPKRSREGAELLRRIKGFKLYMDTAEKYRQKFNEKENIFEKFLPYAIMFGITKQWIRKMEQIYGQEYFTHYHPVWFIGPSFANFNVDSVASEISSMSSHMSSTILSSPSSSGSGGGGFSGGGGGGGGGGGW